MYSNFVDLVKNNSRRRSLNYFNSLARGGGGDSYGDRDSCSTLESEFSGKYIGNGRRLKADKIRNTKTSTYGKTPLNVSRAAPIYKGLLFLQKDRIFSRWKERYFILTRDYLHCFKKSSGSYDKISEMGKFLFKVKLTDIGRLEWSKEKSHNTIVVHYNRNDRITLRCGDELKAWYAKLENCRQLSGERLDFLKISQDPYNAIPCKLAPINYTNPLEFTNHGSLRHPRYYEGDRTPLEARNGHCCFKSGQAYFDEKTLKELKTVQDYNCKFQEDLVIRKNYNPNCELLFRKPTLLRCGRMNNKNRQPYARNSSTSSKLVQMSPYDSINSTIGSAIASDLCGSVNSHIGNYKRNSLQRKCQTLANRKSHEFSENVCYRTNKHFVI